MQDSDSDRQDDGRELFERGAAMHRGGLLNRAVDLYERALAAAPDQRLEQAIRKNLRRARRGKSLPNYRGCAAGLMALVLAVGLALLGLAWHQRDVNARKCVTEALSLSGDAKTVVAEYYLRSGALPSAAAAAELDADYTNPRSDCQSSGQVEDGGVITISINRPRAINGKTVTFVPIPFGNGLDRDCTGGTLAEKFRPSQCR